MIAITSRSYGNYPAHLRGLESIVIVEPHWVIYAREPQFTAIEIYNHIYRQQFRAANGQRDTRLGWDNGYAKSHDIRSIGFREPSIRHRTQRNKLEYFETPEVNQKQNCVRPSEHDACVSMLWPHRLD